MPWNDFTGGWRIDLEQPSKLDATSADIPCLTFSAPEEVDPRPYVVVENQQQVGSCQGHALSTIVEHCYRIEAGKPIQLSRAMAYRATQKIDGINGDRGSTINGGVRLAKETGICIEELWPYTGRYPRNPPSGTSWDDIYAAAKKYRIVQHSRMHSYDDVFNWLASGVGGVHIGIRWSGGMNRAVVNSYRSSGGGHAVALLGYTKRKDDDGRNYILLCNSWGQRWANNGWCEVAPKAIEQMLRARYTVMVGLTDMKDIEPRPIDFRDLV